LRPPATAARLGYVLNGAKTFIIGRLLADLVIVVARTSTDPGDRRAGLTLLVVEDGMPGFTRGRVLNKMGIKTVRCATSSMASCPAPTRQRLRGRADRWGGVACRWLSPGGVVVGRRRSASPLSSALPDSALDPLLHPPHLSARL
jgi:alkylation response protein AidB-like acyl-CoA dehydrogenase